MQHHWRGQKNFSSVYHLRLWVTEDKGDPNEVICEYSTTFVSFVPKGLLRVQNGSRKLGDLCVEFLSA